MKARLQELRAVEEVQPCSAVLQLLPNIVILVYHLVCSKKIPGILTSYNNQ